MNELALFAGMGGGILGGRILGWRTVCAVEINDYCRRILMQRQDDGILEPFPIWDDITTFDGRPWAGCVDIVTGGFPCQDISAAGKGAGIDGERSGLWREMARVIGEVRPRYVLVENSPVLTVRGLGTVLGDLAALGYDAEWGVLGAADLGAPHKRDRIWIVAHALRDRRETVHGRQSVPDDHGHGAAHAPGRQVIESWAGSASPMANPRSGRRGRPQGGKMELSRGTEALGASDDVADADIDGLQGRMRQNGESIIGEICESRMETDRSGSAIQYPDWPADPAETPESGVGRVVDGCPARVDRLKALGNGQVPRVASAAFTALYRRLTTSH